MDLIFFSPKVKGDRKRDQNQYEVNGPLPKRRFRIPSEQRDDIVTPAHEEQAREQEKNSISGPTPLLLYFEEKDTIITDC